MGQEKSARLFEAIRAYVSAEAAYQIAVHEADCHNSGGISSLPDATELANNTAKAEQNLVEELAMFDDWSEDE